MCFGLYPAREGRWMCCTERAHWGTPSSEKGRPGATQDWAQRLEPPTGERGPQEPQRLQTFAHIATVCCLGVRAGTAQEFISAAVLNAGVTTKKSGWLPLSLLHSPRFLFF